MFSQLETEYCCALAAVEVDVVNGAELMADVDDARQLSSLFQTPSRTNPE